MPSPWQWLPTDLLDEDKRKKLSDDWGITQRSRLANEWAEKQRRNIEDAFSAQREQAGRAIDAPIAAIGKAQEGNRQKASGFGRSLLEAATGKQAQEVMQGLGELGQAAQEWGPYVGLAGVAAPLAKPAFEWANENINPRLAEYYSGPELRQETGLPEQIAKAAAGPALTAAARFGREAIEKGPGEALEQSKQRWKDSPEPFPGVKGAYEMAVDPFNAIPIEKAPAILAQGAKKVGPAIKAAREALPELATTARRMAADETGAAQIGGLLGQPQGEYAPTFYSQLERVITTKMGKQAPAKDLQGLLRAQGVKPDEMKWTGFDDFLAERAAKGERVTKQEALDFLAENKIEVEEVVKGAPLDANAVHEAKSARINELTRRRDSLQEQLGQAPFEQRADLRRQIGNTERQIDMVMRQSDTAEVPTKFDQWKTPGGENYRELLLTLPSRPDPVRELLMKANSLKDGDPERAAAIAELQRLHKERGGAPYKPEDYRSSHWSEPNVLAHTRFQEMTDVDGKRVLMVEEIQSDWHQAGRQKGYKGATEPSTQSQIDTLAAERTRAGLTAGRAAAERYIELTRQIDQLRKVDAVPAAPFAKTWPDLVFKRLLRWAAENDFDRIAWTTGKEQTGRYENDLRKAVDAIQWKKLNNNVQVTGIKGGIPVFNEPIPLQGTARLHGENVTLDDALGKSMAARIREASDTSGTLTGQDLTIGGEGMKGFYDIMLPATVEKYVRKWGGKVGETQIPTKIAPKADRFQLVDQQGNVVDEAQTLTIAQDLARQRGLQVVDTGAPTTYGATHSVDITPAMKQSVLYEGQQLAQAQIGPVLDIGSSATGAATGYLTADENATPEERLARAALGAAGGFGASRALRTGRMGFGVEDVSKGLSREAEILKAKGSAPATPVQAIETPPATQLNAGAGQGLPLQQQAPSPAVAGQAAPPNLPPTTAAAGYPSLPRDLAGAKPRYKDTVLTFQSDVDKALYIVGNDKSLSKRDADYMGFLRGIFPDRTDREIRTMGKVARAYAPKAIVGAQGDTAVVTHAGIQKELDRLQKKTRPTATPATQPATAPTGPTRPPIWEPGADTSILGKGQRAEGAGMRTAEPVLGPRADEAIPPLPPGARPPGGPGNIQPPPPSDPYGQLQDALRPDKRPLRERAGDKGNAFMRASYDRNWDLGKLEDATGIPVHKLAQVVSGSVAAGEDRVRRHVLPVVDKMGKDLTHLEEYMVLKRNEDVLARNPQAQLAGGIDQWPGNITALKQLETRLGPERLAKVEAAAKELWRINDEQILQPLVDAGMLSKESYQAIRSANPHYIDFHRADFSVTDGLERIIARPEANVSSLNIKKLELGGSIRKLDQPLARTEAQIIRTATLVSRNRAAKNIVAALLEQEKNLPEAQRLVKQVKGALPAEHSNLTDTISFFHNGERVTFQVPPVFATIAKGLEGETSNTLINILRASSSPLRAGAITYNPAFVVVNPIRDAVSALFREGLVPLSPEYIRGWVAAIAKNSDFTDAAEAGVLMSGIVDNFRSTDALKRAAGVGKIEVNNWKDALALIPRVIERANLTSEQATRIATYHKLKGQGLGRLDAAIRSRDVSVDFAKAGNVMKMVNQVLPFSNAGIQGAANTLRLIKDNPKQAIMASSALAVPTIMTFLWNQRYETSNMIPDYEYANSWILQVGEGTKNPDPRTPNKGEKFPIYIKIPKGPLGGFVTAPVEMAMRLAWAKDDRSVVEHFLNSLGTMGRAISPIEPSVSGIIPPALGTPLGLAMNKDTFTGREIVPQKEVSLKAPEDRYGPENSRQAIALGEMFHVSPRMIDWAVRDYAAGVGQQTMWLADLALGALGYDPAAAPGEAKRQTLTGAEEVAKWPVVARFLGTRNTQMDSQGWEAFNKAVEDSQRLFADVPEIRRLGINMGPVGEQITIKGDVKLNLTPDERAGLQRDTTVILKGLTERVVDRPDYQKLSDREKAAALQKIFTKGREAMRTRYLQNIPRDELRQRLRESFPVAVGQ